MSLFVAVCDLRKEAAERAAAQHSIPNVYTDATDLFAAPDIQGVVCVATSCRFADPATVAQNIAEAQECIDLAADLGAQVVRVFQLRHLNLAKLNSNNAIIPPQLNIQEKGASKIFANKVTVTGRRTLSLIAMRLRPVTVTSLPLLLDTPRKLTVDNMKLVLYHLR